MEPASTPQRPPRASVIRIIQRPSPNANASNALFIPSRPSYAPNARSLSTPAPTNNSTEPQSSRRLIRSPSPNILLPRPSQPESPQIFRTRPLNIDLTDNNPFLAPAFQPFASPSQNSAPHASLPKPCPRCGQTTHKNANNKLCPHNKK